MWYVVLLTETVLALVYMAGQTNSCVHGNKNCTAAGQAEIMQSAASSALTAVTWQCWRVCTAGGLCVLNGSSARLYADCTAGITARVLLLLLLLLCAGIAVATLPTRHLGHARHSYSRCAVGTKGTAATVAGPVIGQISLPMPLATSHEESHCAMVALYSASREQLMRGYFNSFKLRLCTLMPGSDRICAPSRFLNTVHICQHLDLDTLFTLVHHRMRTRVLQASLQARFHSS
jgi:hypothetical protein